MGYWYVSFADDRLAPNGFLGGVCVEASNCMEATETIKRLGIDPGGEALAFDISEFEIPPYPLNTLLTKDAIAEIDGEPGCMRSEMVDNMRDIVDALGHKTRALPA